MIIYWFFCRDNTISKKRFQSLLSFMMLSPLKYFTLVIQHVALWFSQNLSLSVRTLKKFFFINVPSKAISFEWTNINHSAAKIKHFRAIFLTLQIFLHFSLHRMYKNIRTYHIRWIRRRWVDYVCLENYTGRYNIILYVC